MIKRDLKGESYKKFLEAKVVIDEGCGFPCTPEEVHHWCKPFTREIVAWAVRGGRRAIFSSFGLHKTVTQLEVIRLTLQKMGGGRGLIVIPLGVRQEFKRDAAKVGIRLEFVRSDAEVTALEAQQIVGDDRPLIYFTNYESVREGKLNPAQFAVVSLDEAAILRGFGGTKTFREFMATMAGDDRRTNGKNAGGTIKYRFVATATPSPNEFIELLAYAAFLDVMDVGQAKTRFFKRDSTKADALTIHPHKEEEFWLWVSSWALFLQKPSDIGHSDEGYELPPIEVNWIEVPTDHASAGSEKDGQGLLLKNAALGVVDASREKRDSLEARIEKMLELRAEDPKAHRIIWHDLEDERRAIEAALPDTCVSIYGSQDLDEREQAVVDFSDGKIQELAAKPVIAGSGCNFQRHCSWAIFLGIGFKFNDFIQACHRIQRFGQTKPVRIDLIYTEAEREVRRTLERKWAQHTELVAQMTAIIRKHGLSHAAMAGTLTRSLGVERQEAEGTGWKMILNDTVEETAHMEADSVGLILTSIPFSTQYEYTPSYNDFGHTDDIAHFFRQMDFLTPELFRVLQPGRICAIHVKDRIQPCGISNMGFQTVEPFHAKAIDHYRAHGFGYLGMKTIVTDVVRENNQTYRLGYSEQCKDGSRMGVGMPEYLLLFRKPPTDRSNGYADVPVVKSKKEYSLGRWQVDAHGFERSSGNRLLAPEDLKGLPHEKIYKLFRAYSKSTVYDFERHVAFQDQLAAWRILPVTFMLMPPQSWHPDVWSDVARMRTLNMDQAAKGRMMHLCPMQLDVADRAIVQYSNPGDLVFDPFAGIGTVPARAVKFSRLGRGHELNPGYWADSISHCRAAESKVSSPTLFDLAESEEASA